MLWYLRVWVGVVVSERVGWCGGIRESGLVWWYQWELAGVVVSGEWVCVAVSGRVGWCCGIRRVGWCGGIRRVGWCCGIRRVGWCCGIRGSWLVCRYPWELVGVVVSKSLGWCGGI